MERVTGIYAIKNRRNGKLYIGQSSNIYKRFAMHKWMLKTGQHYNKHLQRAWDSGDEFVFEIIEICEPSICNEREIYWIDRYDATKSDKGYNLCLGGEATRGRVCAEQTRRKISASKKGKKSDEETIKKRTQSFKNHLAEDPDFAKAHHERMSQINRLNGMKSKGRKCPEYQKKIVSEKLKGRLISEQHKQKLHDLYCGERSLTAKLKESDVVNIRIRFLKGERQIDLSKCYGVTNQTIYDIVRNRRWRHLPNTLEELEVLKWRENY